MKVKITIMAWTNLIHIGTCGWSYKHWKGIYYPDNLKPTDYLSWYAKEFHTGEINTSFYRLPKKTTVSQWLKEVPEEFCFCPKMSRYLSHMKKLHDAAEPVERFCGIFDEMKYRMGPVLVQLPEGLHFHTEIAENFYTVLKTKKKYRFAMEVRHESWFSDESISLMKKFDITLAFAHSQKFPYLETVTSKDIYMRFHGPNGLYSSAYSNDFLAQYARKMEGWSQDGHTIWVFFNNDIDGHAFRNAATIKKMLEE